MPAELPRPAVTLAVAGVLHVALWPLIGADIGVYLLPWLQHILDHGPIAAFATPFSNYNPPYLYLLTIAAQATGWLDPVLAIKLLSLLGSLALALAMRELLIAVDAPQPARGAALILLVPSVIVSAAVLGQCDAMWTAAAVMAVAAAVRSRHRAMLGWTGLALAFKLQAIFLFPFVAAVVLADRVRWREGWAVAGVYLAALLPAALAGWPLADLLTVYFRQADYIDTLSLNAPNIWALLPAFPFAKQAALALAGLAGLTFIAAAWRRRPQRRDWLPWALAGSMVLPLFLPHMHERYFFLADALALACALSARTWRAWLVAGLVIGASALSLLAYASSIETYVTTGAVLMIAAFALVVRELWPQRDGAAGWSSGAASPVQP